MCNQNNNGEKIMDNKNSEKNIKFIKYLNNSKKNNTKATVELGNLWFLKKLVTEYNDENHLEKAYELYNDAAQKGNPDAMFMCAFMLENYHCKDLGLRDKNNEQLTADDWYIKAASLGNKWSNIVLGMKYYSLMKDKTEFTKENNPRIYFEASSTNPYAALIACKMNISGFAGGDKNSAFRLFYDTLQFGCYETMFMMDSMDIKIDDLESKYKLPDAYKSISKKIIDSVKKTVNQPERIFVADKIKTIFPVKNISDIFTGISFYKELSDYKIGLMYYYGYGVDKDYIMAERFFKSAAQIEERITGESEDYPIDRALSLHMLYKIYEDDNFHVKTDPRDLKLIYDEYFWILRNYWMDVWIDVDTGGDDNFYDSKVRQTSKNAELTNAWSISDYYSLRTWAPEIDYRIGDIWFRMGYYNNALFWYKKSESEFAEYKISQMYKFGIGVEINQGLASIYLKRSALAGDLLSQYQLASEFISEGKYSEAFEMLKKASYNGGIVANTIIGVFYFYGLMENSIELSESYKWFIKAADLGNPVAQFYTAVMEFYGLGVQQCYDNALYWIRASKITVCDDVIQYIDSLDLETLIDRLRSILELKYNIKSLTSRIENDEFSIVIETFQPDSIVLRELGFLSQCINKDLFGHNVKKNLLRYNGYRVKARGSKAIYTNLADRFESSELLGGTILTEFIKNVCIIDHLEKLLGTQ